MIEATTASVMTAQVARSQMEQSSSAQSYASNPVRIQKVAVNNAPYLSPHVRLSPGAKPIFVVRDANTGAQVAQYPTPAQIQAYQSAQASQARLSAAQPQVSSEGQPAIKEVSYEAAKAALQSSVQYQEIKKEVMAQATKAEVPVPTPTPAPQAEAPKLPVSIEA
jgi:hypothetical protein